MKNNNHRVLALKYRPKNFKELLGQEVMVQTISNSVVSGRLPNAYLLTGIRGVGKTTTARLIAKAINCEKNFIAEKSAEYCKCNSCVEIDNFKHLDVLEMDAASRTGIDDVRELIESSKYNPTSAKFKIFIIDEVHMLSKQAFNGLLKTLEEPPVHLKFIFATTEPKKIPLTIVSRCQRFDLHRVSIDVLLENLKKIAKIENCQITEDALKLIAKASEGSVRDSLSLLDRALVTYNISKEEIDKSIVRKMLGIADRSRILELLKFIFIGDQKKSIESLKEITNQGVEPTILLNDILEIIYFILQKKNIGDFDGDILLSEAEINSINLISKDINVFTLMVFWQFLLKGLEELNIVANPILSLEMLFIRLIHLKDMPSYENVLDAINKSEPISAEEKKTDLDKSKFNINENNKISKDQIKNTTQTKPELTTLNPKSLKKEEDVNLRKISSIEDLIKLSSEKKEIELKYDLEKNVNLINFSDKKIDIAFNEKLGKNFVRRLSEKLLEWTGNRWVITLTQGRAQKTFSEQQLINKKQNIEKEKNSEIFKKFKKIFSDGDLTDVSKEE